MQKETDVAATQSSHVARIGNRIDTVKAPPGRVTGHAGTLYPHVPGLQVSMVVTADGPAASTPAAGFPGPHKLRGKPGLPDRPGDTPGLAAPESAAAMRPISDGVFLSAIAPEDASRAARTEDLFWTAPGFGVNHGLGLCYDRPDSHVVRDAAQ